MAHLYIRANSCWVSGCCPSCALIFVSQMLSGASFGKLVPFNCSLWSNCANVQITDEYVRPEPRGLSLTFRVVQAIEQA
jgi:hypothetical protein